MAMNSSMMAMHEGKKKKKKGGGLRDVAITRLCDCRRRRGDIYILYGTYAADNNRLCSTILPRLSKKLKKINCIIVLLLVCTVMNSLPANILGFFTCTYPAKKHQVSYVYIYCISINTWGQRL